MLCSLYEAFDLHALYTLAAARARSTKPKVRSNGGFAVIQCFPYFYKYHVGITSLRGSAEESCRLCTFIWQHSMRSLPMQAIEDQARAIEDVYEEQIYLGLSDWSPEAQGMPYLTAIQPLPRAVQRNLATFDVFVEQGENQHLCIPQITFNPRDNVFLASPPNGYEHLLARAVQSNSGFETSLSLAASWLTEYITMHQICSSISRKNRSLPTRVIDVGSGSPPRNPHLVLTDGKQGSWAALSYCWGGESAFVLKTTTIEEMCKGINELEKFPPTLRDAILVTRSLKMQYLWIDALCIMQDSAEDWAVEAARMSDVYGGATVTISATNSPSTTSGMLGERSLPQEYCRLEWKSTNPREVLPIFLASGSISGTQA